MKHPAAMRRDAQAAPSALSVHMTQDLAAHGVAVHV